jgi:hypothetical protein
MITQHQALMAGQSLPPRFLSVRRGRLLVGPWREGAPVRALL